MLFLILPATMCEQEEHNFILDAFFKVGIDRRDLVAAEVFTFSQFSGEVGGPGEVGDDDD